MTLEILWHFSTEGKAVLPFRVIVADTCVHRRFVINFRSAGTPLARISGADEESPGQGPGRQPKPCEQATACETRDSEGDADRQQRQHDRKLCAPPWPYDRPPMRGHRQFIELLDLSHVDVPKILGLSRMPSA